MTKPWERPSLLDLRNLETFLWVARLSGFGAAAERLNTTQPAVSARIAMLERALGVRLFERLSRRVVLTAKGVELVNYAERMLALRESIYHTVGNPASVHGVLRLGVPETIVHTWLPILIEQINAAYPSITIDITVDSSPDLRGALLAGTLDIAVLFAPVKEPLLKTKKVCSFDLSWVASTRLALPKTRVSLSDAAKWPIVTFRRDTTPYQAIKRLLVKNNLTESRLFASSSIAAMVRMALDGIGICVLPQTVVREEIRARKLRVVDVDCSLPSLEFHVCHQAATDNHLAMAVAGLAVSAARVGTIHKKN